MPRGFCDPHACRPRVFTAFFFKCARGLLQKTPRNVFEHRGARRTHFYNTADRARRNFKNERAQKKIHFFKFFSSLRGCVILPRIAKNDTNSLLMCRRARKKVCDLRLNSRTHRKRATKISNIAITRRRGEHRRPPHVLRSKVLEMPQIPRALLQKKGFRYKMSVALPTQGFHRVLKKINTKKSNEIRGKHA